MFDQFGPYVTCNHDRKYNEVHVVGPTRSWIISSAPYQRSNRYMLILTRQHTQKYVGMIATFYVIASLYSCTYMLASSSSGSSIQLLI